MFLADGSSTGVYCVNAASLPTQQLLDINAGLVAEWHQPDNLEWHRQWLQGFVAISASFNGCTLTGRFDL